LDFGALALFLWPFSDFWRLHQITDIVPKVGGRSVFNALSVFTEKIFLSLKYIVIQIQEMTNSD
ncbi:MAG: hypothetical protein KAT56_01520, partial [Sedimentisphaerales bacterium]|nr:hypothetical protein [Sedimentisphaerales bacterium]